MSPDPRRSLEVALRELADVEPPAGLADAALARADRVRRRRIGTVVVAAFTVLAVVAGVTAATGAFRHRTAPAATTPLGYYVAAYDIDTKYPDRGELWVLDPARGRYVRTPFFHGDVSPDGRRILVSDSAGYAVTTLAAAKNGRAGAVALTEIDDWKNLLAPQWSPDGRILLLPVAGGGGLARVQLIDPRNGHVRRVTLAGGPYGRGLTVDTTLFWGPDPGTIAVLESEVMGRNASLRLFDLDGRLRSTTSLRGPATPLGGQLAQRIWSPDHKVVASTDNGLLDLRRREPGLVIGASAVAGWYRDHQLIVLSWPGRGKGKDKELRILDLDAGHLGILRHIPYDVPHGDNTRPQLVRLTGAAPAGAIVI